MKAAPDFWQSKTTRTAAGTIVITLGLALCGVIQWGEAVQTIFAAVAATTLRDAIVKGHK